MKFFFFLVILITRFLPSLSYYEYFLFTQQWQPTVCMNGRCAVKSLQKFTIHGLWPTNASKPYPEWCKGKRSRSFNHKLISGLEPQLRTDWPDIVKGNDVGFWTDQWEKHGTCSLNNFQQLEYFKLALAIFKRGISLTNALKQGGIVPHKTGTHKVADIEKAIKKHNGNTDPGLLCIPRTPYLKEIRLCLYPNGTTNRNCPPAVSSTNCPNDVILPP